MVGFLRRTACKGEALCITRKAGYRSDEDQLCTSIMAALGPSATPVKSLIRRRALPSLLGSMTSSADQPPDPSSALPRQRKLGWMDKPDCA